jgi:gluconolactonase
VDTGRSHNPDGPAHIRVFDVAGERLRGGEVLVDMGIGSADGVRTDLDGNLWAAAGWGGAGYDGVHCFAPNGDLIGRIHLPEPCSNLCFGGRKKNRLFMTCGQSVYSLYVETRGAQTP